MSVSAYTTPDTIAIGVLGGAWRGSVTTWGAVQPWDGSAPLDWFIAADDRWHVPRDESAVRQTRMEGAPVIETRVRVPGGDAVHRVHATAHDGGLTVIEVENESSLPFAVAFSRPDLLATRPPTEVPVQGIELPAGSIVVPVGHRSSVTVALAHDGRGAGPIPADLPPARSVARGWVAVAERASRIVAPDAGLVERLISARCEVALGALDDPDDDPVAFVLGVAEVIRMGERAGPWVPEVVGIVERMAKERRAGGLPWDLDRATISLGEILSIAGEHRALADLADLRQRLGARTSAALALPGGVRAVAWIEDLLVRPTGDGACTLLPDGLPTAWFGSGFEAYRLPAGDGHHVSLAVRWHGERPALLWEVSGPVGLQLHGGGLDPSWSTAQPSGEVLLDVPPGAPVGEPESSRESPPDPTSFS